MIDVEIKKSNEKQDILVFPVIAKNKKRHFFVLFFNSTSGMVIKKSPSGDIKEGYFSNSWYDVTSEEIWEVFPKAKITIEI